MKILVLCSGGDAPGMNRFIYTLSKNFDDVYYAYKGFKGLVEGDIRKLDKTEIEKVKDEAGAYIRSSRYPEFKERKYFLKGLKNALKFDVTVVLGGNGSQKGAKELKNNGANVLFVPATIDNDMEGAEYSIGFDTAVYQCVYTVENSMPSFHTFSKTCLYKVMGRYCPKIAEAVFEKTNADYLIASENDLKYSKIKKIIKENEKKDKGTAIIVKEKIINIDELKSKLETYPTQIRVQTVGYLQRGGKPTKTELKKADQIANQTSKLIKAQNFGNSVAFEKLEKITVKPL